jgi:hypothetical protein
VPPPQDSPRPADKKGERDEQADLHYAQLGKDRLDDLRQPQHGAEIRADQEKTRRGRQQHAPVEKALPETGRAGQFFLRIFGLEPSEKRGFLVGGKPAGTLDGSAEDATALY